MWGRFGAAGTVTCVLGARTGAAALPRQREGGPAPLVGVHNIVSARQCEVRFCAKATDWLHGT